MQVKNTIKTPIIGGLILGALSYLTTLANLTIQITQDLILGPWEIFNVISAALFGPIGLLITELGLDVSGYIYLIRGVYPTPQDIYFMMGNYIAHILALLPVAVGYRFIHQRIKMPWLLVGWIPILFIYYLVGVPLSVLLHNLAVPGLENTFAAYFKSIRLEFILVVVVTSLIMLALPEPYRRPYWYETKKTPDRTDDIQITKKAGTQR